MPLDSIFSHGFFSLPVDSATDGQTELQGSRGEEPGFASQDPVSRQSRPETVHSVAEERKATRSHRSREAHYNLKDRHHVQHARAIGCGRVLVCSVEWLWADGNSEPHAQSCRWVMTLSCHFCFIMHPSMQISLCSVPSELILHWGNFKP